MNNNAVVSFMLSRSSKHKVILEAPMPLAQRFRIPEEIFIGFTFIAQETYLISQVCFYWSNNFESLRRNTIRHIIDEVDAEL